MIFNSNDESHSVINLTGKVRMLSIFFNTEFMSQNTIPRIPKIIYVSLYTDWILNQSSGI